MVAASVPHLSCGSIPRRAVCSVARLRPSMQRLRLRTASIAAATSQTEQLLAPAPEQPSELMKVLRLAMSS